MSYVTDGTVWPVAVTLDDSVKDVISLFYQLADDNSAQAGPRLASEVFTPNGEFVTVAGTLKGSDEISRSREQTQARFPGRRHNIRKVFVNDKQGHDLFVLGHAKMDLVNGKSVETDFATHILINVQSNAAKSPRLEFAEVFATAHQ
ncbi:hypothetical protein EDD37DRAFT_70452 [Exophiala viscosa]|uniref:uncharacterized protein n=1 Tax=Exophiala viscosa TaxID=2486360 RepID=UPI00218EE022|nr:hypothetical protein EDD37DRAFT_70452 [Exophiala viscosa]